MSKEILRHCPSDCVKKFSCHKGTALPADKSICYVSGNVSDNGLSEAQKIRQRRRDSGKYSRYPKCEICNKRVNPEKYYSLPDCNETGFGVCICESCAKKEATKRSL